MSVGGEENSSFLDEENGDKCLEVQKPQACFDLLPLDSFWWASNRYDPVIRYVCYVLFRRRHFYSGQSACAYDS